jgi:tetratricopeptide (TPR) repeat protein
MKRAVLLVLPLLLVSCAARNTPGTVPTPEEESKIREASAALAGRNYQSFKKAFRLYAGLCARPGLQRALAEDYLRAGLLLGLRQKDLGIVDPVPLDTVGRLISIDPRLASYRAELDIARLLSHRSRGIMSDVDPQVVHYYDHPDELQKLIKTVAGRSASSEVAAYVLAEYEGYDNHKKIEPDLDALLRLHPSSLLLRFVKAAIPRENPELLEELLAADPACLEVHYFLGNASLAQGHLLEGERRYERALEAIPESPQITVRLAGVAFATEDFERSVGFYDQTLALMPEFREAFLGKAIGLSYLGRSAEAMEILQHLLDLGEYLMGESHFWLAWNLYAMERYAEARDHIEEAKKLLGEGQVYTLAGQISVGLKEDEAAKSNFLEALKFSPSDSDALFGLSGIFARQQLWEKSGDYARRAAEVHEAQVASLGEKLAEIKASTLSENRKAKLARRKQAQIDQALLLSATCFYNAAAAFVNAGLTDKALPCALKAASHPALKDKAQDLADRIRSSTR